MKALRPLLTLLVLPLLTNANPVDVQRDECSAGPGISAARAQQVNSAFRSARIIPDILSSINPTTDVQVAYGAKKMNLGNSFAVTETLQAPKYAFAPESGYDPTTTKYTLLYVDPDAPGPELPIIRSYLHYLAYDVQPDCVSSQSPEEVAPYMPLTPLSVASHRYVYLVFRQPPGQFTPIVNPIDLVTRAPFNVPDFITKNKLQLVGGNFMREGIASSLVGVVPFSTQDGIGYKGPLNGTAEPADGIGNLLSQFGL